MTDLYPWAPADGVEVLIRWLIPLGEVRDKRPYGSPVPWHVVRRLSGGSFDGLTDVRRYAVDTFHTSEAEAQREAATAEQRIQLLIGPFVGQVPVTISTGDVYVDGGRIIESPRLTEDFDPAMPSGIVRFTGIYEMGLRIS